MSSKKQTCRINLEVSPNVRIQLDKLKAKTEAESITEVIRRALRCYETIVDLKKTDSLILKSGQKETEVVFLK